LVEKFPDDYAKGNPAVLGGQAKSKPAWLSIYLACLTMPVFFRANQKLLATKLRVREVRSGSTAELSDSGVVAAIYRGGTPWGVEIQRCTPAQLNVASTRDKSTRKLLEIACSIMHEPD
jgi:hypothetical protein